MLNAFCQVSIKTFDCNKICFYYSLIFVLIKMIHPKCFSNNLSWADEPPHFCCQNYGSHFIIILSAVN